MNSWSLQCCVQKDSKGKIGILGKNAMSTDVGSTKICAMCLLSLIQRAINSPDVLRSQISKKEFLIRMLQYIFKGIISQ